MKSGRPKSQGVKVTTHSQGVKPATFVGKDKLGITQSKGIVFIPTNINSSMTNIREITAIPIQEPPDGELNGQMDLDVEEDDVMNVVFMNCIFWNSRGTGAKSFPGLIRDLSQRYKVDIFCISETRQSGEKVEAILNKLGFDRWEKTDANGYSGGLWVLWKSGKVKVDVVEKHNQYIHVKVSNGSMEWLLTAVYGSPTISKRRELWERLRSIHSSVNKPWVVAGDFNAFLFQHEKFGGRSGGSKPDVNFKGWVEDTGMIDLKASGSGYTWKRQNVAARLDRVLVNMDWYHKFPEASGANVSRLWRGVTKQWGSVLNGLEWRLGNGSDTKFWHDRWVNGCDALINYAFASPSSVAINDTVAAFTTASGEWDWSKFEYLLPAHVCSRIASMVPPGNSNRKDVPAWRFSNNGSFSVKTAYKVLSNNEDLFKDPLWKHIWSWQGPQRIKSFLWLCGHDKVLSNVVRKNRGMTQDDGCAKCGDCQEDLLHILRDCASIKNVWLRIVEFKHWPVFFNLNLREWLNFNFSRNLGYGEIEWNLHFGVTCWMAWKWRNEFIFNGRTSGVGDPALYIHQYCRFVRSAFSLVGKEGQGSRVAVRIAWVPPPDGWIKVNVDGSVDPGSFGSSACGGVLRDRDGNFLCGFSRNVGSCSITLTELWGVLSGLQVAWNRGFKKVIIETDCLNAKRLIYQNFEEGYCSAQLVDEIHKSIAQDWDVVVQHVFKEANFVADKIAQLGHYEDFGIRIIEQPPDCIHKLLYEDIHGRGVLRSCIA
ncbi:Non-LTR retroelement reverse transcriptase [Senna tora]|uniref:Non-LTR retroelement reverse transcriptase n=1 Tax=Senna tora TaxID=362788 RepID=A0A834TDJ5_9FABA|nr:Non-LTR retroelement reverse transcriptase [Senna tora]